MRWKVWVSLNINVKNKIREKNLCVMDIGDVVVYWFLWVRGVKSVGQLYIDFEKSDVRISDFILLKVIFFWCDIESNLKKGADIEDVYIMDGYIV